MGPQPDDERDIIIHVFVLVDALTGDELGERWSVWCGRESAGAFESEAEALAAARAAAEDSHRPVWLLRTGQPPSLLADF
jgi:hypothetical protein